MKLFKTLIAITIAIISSTTFACETGGCTKTPTIGIDNTAGATASAAANPTQNLTSSPTATGTASAAANPTATSTGTFMNDGRQTTTVNAGATSGSNSAANVGNVGSNLTLGNVGGGSATIQEGAVKNTVTGGAGGNAALNGSVNSNVDVKSMGTASVGNVAGGSVQSGAIKNDVAGSTQDQTQSTSSISSATTGASTSNGGSSSANNSGVTGNNVNIDQRQVRQTPPAVAPAIYQVGGCSGSSTSGGASTGVFAFSIGRADIDRECQINQAEITLRQMAAIYGEESAADMAIRIRCKSELLSANAEECRAYRDAVKKAVIARQEHRDAEVVVKQAITEEAAALREALRQAEAERNIAEARTAMTEEKMALREALSQAEAARQIAEAKVATQAQPVKIQKAKKAPAKTQCKPCEK